MAERARAGAFPFSVPAIAQLPALDLSADVTLFVGENGSGKSTLLEAMACAAELVAIGGNAVDRDDTLAPQRALAKELRLAWRPRSRQGFFLRAEDFFGHLRRQARDDARLDRERLTAYRENHGLPPLPAPDPTATTHIDEDGASRYVGERDARSHGESFMDLFVRRIRPGGLYLLDEPEAPLSPRRQLAFLRILVEAAAAGAQLVIATHSPILLACPGARIFSFDALPIREVAYEGLEHVTVTRDFLNNPEAFLDCIPVRKRP